MYKRGLAVGMTVFLLAGLWVTTSLANRAFSVMIGDKPLQTLVPVQVIDDRVMAPVRDIAEALGAKVSWDGESKTVHIDDTKDKHIQLLEQALVVKDPLDAAYNFANGIKTGNGAWQYALMTPDFRNDAYDIMDFLQWDTSQYGPELDNFSIIASEHQSKELVKVTMELVYVDSEQNKSQIVVAILVLNIDEQWYVASFGNDVYLAEARAAMLEQFPLPETTGSEMNDSETAPVDTNQEGSDPMNSDEMN